MVGTGEVKVNLLEKLKAMAAVSDEKELQDRAWEIGMYLSKARDEVVATVLSNGEAQQVITVALVGRSGVHNPIQTTATRVCLGLLQRVLQKESAPYSRAALERLVQSIPLVVETLLPILCAPDDVALGTTATAVLRLLGGRLFTPSSTDALHDAVRNKHTSSGAVKWSRVMALLTGVAGDGLARGNTSVFEEFARSGWAGELTAAALSLSTDEKETQVGSLLQMNAVEILMELMARCKPSAGVAEKLWVRGVAPLGAKLLTQLRGIVVDHSIPDDPLAFPMVVPLWISMLNSVLSLSFVAGDAEYFKAVAAFAEAALDESQPDHIRGAAAELVPTLGMADSGFELLSTNPALNLKYKSGISGEPLVVMSVLHSLASAIRRRPTSAETRRFMLSVLTAAFMNEVQQQFQSVRDSKVQAVFFQLYEQLAAIDWGRKLLLTTVGLLSFLLEHWADNDTEQARWKHCILAGLSRDRTLCLEHIDTSVYLLLADRVNSGPYSSGQAEARTLVATESV